MELSIVLVIVGLVVGGVLAGKSLIRSSELQTIPTERAKYQTAALAFREKYFMLPGDLSNATQFWGEVSAINCGLTNSTNALTCNGNGDTKILLISAASYEYARFWQHLANAKLIEGTYNGIGGSPNAKFSGSIWGAFYYIKTTSTAAAGSTTFTGDFGNALILNPGPQSTFGSIFPTGTPSSLTNQELWLIDAKFDDGKPGTGQIVVLASPISACTNATLSTDTNADYTINDSYSNCSPIFTRQF